jgi:hypothetical protein
MLPLPAPSGDLQLEVKLPPGDLVPGRVHTFVVTMRNTGKEVQCLTGDSCAPVNFHFETPYLYPTLEVVCSPNLPHGVTLNPGQAERWMDMTVRVSEAAPPGEHTFRLVFMSEYQWPTGPLDGAPPPEYPTDVVTSAVIRFRVRAAPAGPSGGAGAGGSAARPRQRTIVGLLPLIANPQNG